MKDELKADFIKIIKHQIDDYKKLKNIMTQENKMLINKDIKGVEEVIKKEESTVAEIRNIEEEKLSLFKQMIKDLNLNNDNTIKIVDMLAKIDKKDSKEIENVIVELINTVKDVEATNRSNMHMIKNYLEYTNFMKKIKERSSQTIQTTYNEYGYKETVETKKKSTVDKTI